MIYLTAIITGVCCSILIIVNIFFHANKSNLEENLKSKKLAHLIFNKITNSKLDLRLSKENILTLFRKLIKKNSSTIIYKYNFITSFFLLSFLPIFIFIIYYNIGSPENIVINYKESPFGSLNLISKDFYKQSSNSNNQKIKQLINDSYYYKDTGNVDAEINSLESAIFIQDDLINLKLLLVDALTRQALGKVTPTARNLIAEILKVDPNNIQALYFAGLTAKQNDRSDLAKKIWIRIYNSLPSNSDVSKIILDELNKLDITE